MSDNLYAPPQADLSGPASATAGGGDLDVGRCFSEAWARTWENFPLWLGAGLVFLLALTASIVSILGIVLLVPILYWGGFAFTLRMHDRSAALKDLFSGFSRYGAALAGMLGFYLLSVVIGLPGNVVVQLGMNSDPPNWGLVAIGYVASLGIAVFVTIRLTFAPFLMVDRGLGLGEALSEAWAQTAQLKLKVVLLMLASVAAVIAGMIAFLVGVIPGMVVSFLMWASAYRQIFGGAPQPAA